MVSVLKLNCNSHKDLYYLNSNPENMSILVSVYVVLSEDPLYICLYIVDNYKMIFRRINNILAWCSFHCKIHSNKKNGRFTWNSQKRIVFKLRVMSFENYFELF